MKYLPVKMYSMNQLIKKINSFVFQIVIMINNKRKILSKIM